MKNTMPEYKFNHKLLLIGGILFVSGLLLFFACNYLASASTLLLILGVVLSITGAYVMAISTNSSWAPGAKKTVAERKTENKMRNIGGGLLIGGLVIMFGGGLIPAIATFAFILSLILVAIGVFILAVRYGLLWPLF